mmetsp:Transcript_5931/g.20729  ORF Transcript_5931/g.20729 Transcript_5931/m.20729 type:complete len:205 (+) Transcript_5931:8179-8793(+)
MDTSSTCARDRLRGVSFTLPHTIVRLSMSTCSSSAAAGGARPETAASCSAKSSTTSCGLPSVSTSSASGSPSALYPARSLRTPEVVKWNLRYLLSSGMPTGRHLGFHAGKEPLNTSAFFTDVGSSSSTVQMQSPVSSAVPATMECVSLPVLAATSGITIFIASISAYGLPSVTCPPSGTRNPSSLPVLGAVSLVGSKSSGKKHG